MASREHILYRNIVALYERDGYTVEREFRVLLPEAEAGRLIDVIAFKWKRGDVDVVAVEAKHANRRAGVLRGIAQGVEYQVLVPHVSLAAQATSTLLGHVGQALQTIGLGYIEVEPGSGARLASSPKPAPWFDEEVYERTVRPAAMLVLMAPLLAEATGMTPVIRTAVRRPVRAKGARQKRVGEPTWFCSVFVRGAVQIMLQVRTDHPAPTACLWVEGKPALRRLWRSADAEWLADLVAESGVSWTVSARERVVRSLGVPTGVRRIDGDPAQTRRVIRWARRQIDRPRVCPVVEARIPLWGAGTRPTRREAESVLKSAAGRLAPIREAVEARIRDS